MFSAITLNWRGRPLETHEVVVETIAATTTKTGLSIQAVSIRKSRGEHAGARRDRFSLVTP
jgi:hypothetical protein